MCRALGQFWARPGHIKEMDRMDTREPSRVIAMNSLVLGKGMGSPPCLGFHMGKFNIFGEKSYVANM